MIHNRIKKLISAWTLLEIYNKIILWDGEKSHVLLVMYIRIYGLGKQHIFKKSTG